jgi:regulation of enolase protein 1 (concanavalin A-like superfamily)
MQDLFLNETFSGPGLSPRLQWLNPPSNWRLDARSARLTVQPGAGTDFWQRTHYGFRFDNGHFLFAEIPGDFVITATVHAFPVHQYDQAGVMVRASADCWLKTSVEFEPDGPSQLGVVVTNDGYSDWSMQDFPSGAGAGYCLRVGRTGQDFLVEHSADLDGPWHLLRVAHLFAKPGPLCAGFYACSPKGPGFRAEAALLRIEIP